METKSSNNPSRRRRNNRPSGGNRNRRGKRGGQNRRSGGGGNQNRSGNRGGGNRNRNRGGRNRSRRRPEPKSTAWEKFLSTISFGLLGKPKRKKGRKPAPQEPKKTERQKAAERAAQQPEKPKRNKGTREEVTSGRLYVGNLDYSTTEADLEELFRGAGNVLSAEVVTNARTQQSKGFAFVVMGSIHEAKRAVEILDDEDFQGRRLIVSGARSEGPRETDEAEDEAPEAEDTPPSGEPAEAEETEEAPEAAEDTAEDPGDASEEAADDETPVAETAAEPRS